jgi:hypothetical protein
LQGQAFMRKIQSALHTAIESDSPIA